MPIFTNRSIKGTIVGINGRKYASSVSGSIKVTHPEDVAKLRNMRSVWAEGKSPPKSEVERAVEHFVNDPAFRKLITAGDLTPAERNRAVADAGFPSVQDGDLEMGYRKWARANPAEAEKLSQQDNAAQAALEEAARKAAEAAEARRKALAPAPKAAEVAPIEAPENEVDPADAEEAGEDSSEVTGGEDGDVAPAPGADDEGEGGDEDVEPAPPVDGAPKWEIPAEGEGWPAPVKEMGVKYLRAMADAYSVKYTAKLKAGDLVHKIKDAVAKLSKK